MGMRIWLGVWFLLSCADHRGSLTKRHEDLFKKGKRVAYAGQKEFGSLALSGTIAGAIEVKKEEGLDHVTGVVFDTRVSEKVAVRDLADHAKKVIDEYGDWFSVSSKDLVPAKRWQVAFKEGRQIHLNYLRRWNGVLVRDSFVEVIYYSDPSLEGVYRLGEIQNFSYGAIVLASDGPLVNMEEYLAKEGLDDYELIGATEMILPIVEAGDYSFHKVTSAQLNKIGSDEGMTVTLKNEDEDILEAYSHKLNLEGRLLGKSFPQSYLDQDLNLYPLKQVEYLIGGQQQRTDLDGRFQIERETPVQVALANQRGIIYDTLTGELVVLDTNLNEGDIELGVGDNQIKAFNTLLAVQRVNTHAREFISPRAVPFLDSPVNVVINVQQNCNAFYDTQLNSLNFFVEGSGCADTALINDVIYHEWGHGLDFYTGRQGGITDGAFSEGIGDIVSFMLTGDPELARGFMLGQNDTGIRRAQNSARFPDDQGEVHIEGQIIGGAFWDMRAALMERYGAQRGSQKAAELFYNHILTTDSYRESYMAVLRLDDDDDNPATPSPNRCLINKAFADHGLADPLDCTDDVTLPEVPFAEDLKIALEPSGDQMVLMGSTGEKVAQLGYCLGDVLECQDKAAMGGYLNFEGVSAQGRFIYKSESPLDLGEFSRVTLVILDETPAMVGYKSFKLVLK